MKLTVGMDIGGTKIAAAAVDEAGTIVAQDRRSTPAQEPPMIVAAAADLIRSFQADLDIAAVGVACAGFIDREGTTVLFAPNLAWRDEPMQAQLQDATGLPVVIENDANAAAWGEYRFGPVRDHRCMVFITVGTGVGGGIVAEGQLLKGAAGLGAELGHLRVVPDGLRCGCGNRGCWEQYASGNALVREARELVASGSPLAKALVERCDGDPDRLTGPDVTAAATDGDPGAIELIADLGRWLGEGAASVAAILDPDVFVLGGGVAAAGDLLLEPTVSAFRRQLTGRGYRPDIEWELAVLGNDAGMIGAAGLAAEYVEARS